MIGPSALATTAAPATAPAAEAAARPTRGAMRWLRVVTLGGISLLLATVAHVAGGGRLPSVGLLATTGLLLGLVAATMTAWRCRFGVLLAVLGIQQALLHLLFDAATPVSPGCGVSVMTGMNHAGHLAVQLCDPAMVAAVGHPPTWVMGAAHLAATALTAALLARGEAWLWRVAEQIARAATATPAGWPEPVRAQVVSGGPERPFAPALRTPAEPRAPPPVLAVF